MTVEKQFDKTIDQSRSLALGKPKSLGRWALLSWAVVACAGWGSGYLFRVNVDQETRATISIYQKKTALANAAHSQPRLILVGGSSTYFGLSAGDLAQKLNQPVLNLGFHAGLGLDLILGTAEQSVRSGDVILLFPEYELMARSDGNMNSIAGAVSTAIAQPNLGETSPQEVANKLLIAGSPGLSSFTTTLWRAIDQIGSYAQISERGDAVELPQGNPTPDRVDAQVSEYSLQRLQRFRQTIETKGGKLVIGLPWVLTRGDEKSQQSVQHIAKTLTGIAPVLYDTQSLNIKTDRSLFGDTPYHLSPQGRTTRTAELAEQIKAANLP